MPDLIIQDWPSQSHGNAKHKKYRLTTHTVSLHKDRTIRHMDERGGGGGTWDMPVPTAPSPFFLRRRKPSMGPEGCFFCFCCFSFLAATRFSPTCLLRLRRHTNHRHRASKAATTIPPTTPEGRQTITHCIYYVCLRSIAYPHPIKCGHNEHDIAAKAWLWHCCMLPYAKRQPPQHKCTFTVIA